MGQARDEQPLAFLGIPDHHCTGPKRRSHRPALTTDSQAGGTPGVALERKNLVLILVLIPNMSLVFIGDQAARLGEEGYGINKILRAELDSWEEFGRVLPGPGPKVPDRHRRFASTPNDQPFTLGAYSQALGVHLVLQGINHFLSGDVPNLDLLSPAGGNQLFALRVESHQDAGLLE